MHESLDEFKFQPDTTTDSRVICPCASEKLTYNVVNTLAPLFLIGSPSYLQVTRTSITSRTSSKFGQIGPRTAEHTCDISLFRRELPIFFPFLRKSPYLEFQKFPIYLIHLPIWNFRSPYQISRIPFFV